MRSRLIFLTLLSFAVATAALLADEHRAAPSAPASYPQAHGFRLSDQFGTSYAIDFPQDKVCVLVMSDRNGYGQVEGWVRPIYDRYRERLRILGIANLPEVPESLRPLVRNLVRRAAKVSIMLDWSGSVARDYDYPGGTAGVRVIDRAGRILHRVDGAADSAVLDACYRAIDGSLPPAEDESAAARARGEQPSGEPTPTPAAVAFNSPQA